MNNIIMKNKLKVLHIIPSFGTGGAEKVVLTYAQQLKNDKDIEISVLVLSKNRERLYERIVEKEKLNFHFLNLDRSKSLFRLRLSQIKQERSFIKEYRPDVIHIHLSIVWVVCAAIIGIHIPKKFHTLHSDPCMTSVGKNRWIDRWCYRLFGITPICLNNEMASHSNKIFHRNDTLVLHNAIDIDTYKDKSRRKVYREKYGIHDDDFVVGNVGRLEKVKNHEKVLSVFKELLKLQPNAFLILVGEGSQKENLQLLAKEYGIIDKVFFVGTTDDVPGYMSAFDCFIFTSLYEGLGIVMLEAQASGVKCVMADTVPYEVIVSDCVSVLRLSDDDKLWATALLESRGKYSVNEQYLNEFSLNSVISKLKSFYI